MSRSTADDDEISAGIPITYVPARNTIFLAFALSYAESIGARDILHRRKPGRLQRLPRLPAEFIQAFESMANLATKAGVEGKSRFHIMTPLITLTKAEIIKRGLELGVDYSLTWSCYQGGERACGRCDSCKIRLAGFAQAGAPDPLEYDCRG